MNDKINYWITVHWPQMEDEEFAGPAGVFLPDDRGLAGKELKPGDLIFIYQSITGRNIKKIDPHGNINIRKYSYGRGAIIGLVEATSGIYSDDTAEITHYTDGTKIKWSWYATTKCLSTNGFVDRETVNKILGYKKNYSLRGFGDKHSGLKKISHQQFNDILSAFNKNSKLKERKYKPVKNKKGGESKAHLELKNKVADNPSLILNEKGLCTYRVEYPFPSGDRADIVLIDRFNRVIGVEIELKQDEFHFEGVLQAIKYRFMLAYMFEIDYSNTRAMLVAHKISEDLKKSCDKYDVEFFEID